MPADAIQIIREGHAALAAMLRSLGMLIQLGPGDKPHRFFETIRWMLFYVDEFPEKHHHRNESKYLFPAILKNAPDLRPVVDRLEAEHANGERRVRDLQHLLMAWEILGDSRREAFVSAFDTYLRFYLEHMQIEEKQLLPLARRAMAQEEQAALDASFAGQRDPLAGGEHAPEFEALFSRIVQQAPAPIGLADE